MVKRGTRKGNGFLGSSKDTRSFHGNLVKPSGGTTVFTFEEFEIPQRGYIFTRESRSNNMGSHRAKCSVENCFGNQLGLHVVVENGIEVMGTEQGLQIWMHKRNGRSSKVRERYFHISKTHIVQSVMLVSH